MKFSEFENEVRRLKRVYGENKYPDERVAGIFDAISVLPLDLVNKQVSKFIAESDRPPFLNSFIEAFGSVLSDLRKQYIEKKLENEPSCTACGNCGVVTGYSKVGFNSTAFQCFCKRGKLFYPNFAPMHEGLSKDYISHREWVSGRWKVVLNENKLKVVPHDSDMFDERPNAKNSNVGSMKKADYSEYKEIAKNGNR